MKLLLEFSSVALFLIAGTLMIVGGKLLLGLLFIFVSIAFGVIVFKLNQINRKN